MAKHSFFVARASLSTLGIGGSTLTSGIEESTPEIVNIELRRKPRTGGNDVEVEVELKSPNDVQRE